MLDVRSDFPYTRRVVNGQPFIYMDSAATTQKPQCVIDCITGLYTSGISNVHRSATFLADEVTECFEDARVTVARFLRAQTQEIVFTSGATHAIQIVAHLLRSSGPIRVLVSTLEHHSNFLPWTQDSVELLNWSPDGLIDLADLERKLATKPDLVTIAAASNFLGTLQPLSRIGDLCRSAGVPLLVDACQSIAHDRTDVQQIGCDFLVFSGHKIYGPSGVGVLYIRAGMAANLRPVFLGGTMVKEAHADSCKWNDVPLRFEPGTPNIEGVIGLAAAIDYLSGVGLERIAAHEFELGRHLRLRLASLPRLRILGPDVHQPAAPLVSFHLQGFEAGMVAKTLSLRSKIIVRSGFLCAQPAHDAIDAAPSVRASLGIYNTMADIDALIAGLETIQRVAS